jgi:hypothetical protein
VFAALTNASRAILRLCRVRIIGAEWLVRHMQATIPAIAGDTSRGVKL